LNIGNAIFDESVKSPRPPLTRDVKLLNLIISSFIPPEYKNRIESKAIYNEEENIWTYQSTHSENTSITSILTMTGLYNPGWGKWGTPHEDFGPEAQNHRKNEEF